MQILSRFYLKPVGLMQTDGGWTHKAVIVDSDGIYNDSRSYEWDEANTVRDWLVELDINGGLRQRV